MNEPIPVEVIRQIDGLALDAGRPLLICDADEVLFAFLRGLDQFLHDGGLELRLDSFALTGNIRHRHNGEALEAADVRDLLQRFFAERTESLEPIDGAAAALTGLSERMQVMVLTNIPQPQRDARRRALRKHGMDFPVVANAGRKGAAVARLAARVEAPVVFVDDIPHNIDSVAEHADDVIRLHFVGDERLARMIGPASGAHARHDTWPEARDYIEGELLQRGY